jgi:hypothetical protein
MSKQLVGINGARLLGGLNDILQGCVAYSLQDALYGFSMIQKRMGWVK